MLARVKQQVRWCWIPSLDVMAKDSMGLQNGALNALFSRIVSPLLEHELASRTLGVVPLGYKLHGSGIRGAFLCGLLGVHQRSIL